MYHVYWNQAAAAYLSLYFFIFLSLQFSALKFLVTLFSGTMRCRRLKLGTHVDSGQMYHLFWTQAAAAYSSLYSFRSVRVAERLGLPTSVHEVPGSNPAGGEILPEPIFNIEIFCHTFLENCES